jgi:hypothetical protein
MRRVRQWLSVNRPGLGYLLVFTVNAALFMVFSTTLIKPDYEAPLQLGIIVMNIALARVLIPLAPRRVILVAAYLVGLLTIFLALPAFWKTVLVYRGVQVTATVADARDISRKAYEDFRYTLIMPDGQRIRGHLNGWPDLPYGESEEGSVGDQVAVVYDPKGLADPRLPEELTHAKTALPVVVVLYLATAGLCMLTGRPAPDPDPDDDGQRGAGPRAVKGSKAKRTAAVRNVRARAERKERELRHRRRNRRDHPPETGRPPAGSKYRSLP